MQGRITVTGTINGTPMTASVVDSVSDRHWPETMPPVSEAVDGCAAPQEGTSCRLLYPPVQVHDLGSTFGAFRLSRLAPRAAHVDSGPNAGFSYVAGTESPATFEPIVVRVNRALFDDADPIWQRQSICTRVQMLQWVRDHEAAHVRLRKEGIERGVANSYPIESQVLFNSLAEMQQYLTAMEPDVISYARSLGDPLHVVHPEVWTAIPAPCRITDVLIQNPQNQN